MFHIWTEKRFRQEVKNEANRIVNKRILINSLATQQNRANITNVNAQFYARKEWTVDETYVRKRLANVMSDEIMKMISLTAKPDENGTSFRGTLDIINR